MNPQATADATRGAPDNPTGAPTGTASPSNRPLRVDAVNEMVRTAFPGSTNECAAIGDGFALARAIPNADAIRPGGYISGPTQFAIADGALWYLVFAVIGRVEPMALTSELSMRFLRPAVGSVLWARATLESAGRRQIVGSVRVWTDDNEQEPSSVGQGTYVLPRQPSS